MSSIVYILVNPTSGGNLGGSIMELAKEKMVFEDLNITLKIYDIREGDSGNKPSFLQMKADIKLNKEINKKEQLARALNSRSLYANLSFLPNVPRKNTGRSLTTQNSDMSNDYSDDEADPIRVVIAGGDGTVMWGMMELGNHDISPSDIVIAPLPLGTGNDFSRATGWGSSLPLCFTRKNLKALKIWLSEILAAAVFNFDLWSVKIQLNREKGSFHQVKDNTSITLRHKVPSKSGELVDENVTTLHKMCCNYFSTGVESRIGYGFEKNRTTNQLLNKFYYGTESFKKLMFHKHVRINDYIKSITYENDGKMVVIDPKKSFLSNPISLIFQNIPSMASGCDFWSGSYKNADKEIRETNETAITRTKDNLLKSKQEIGDGKIELMTIKTLLNYSKAQAGVTRGVAKRVTQARGPFLLEFEESYDEKVYFEVDGEHYACMKPTSFSVKYSRSYRILVKKSSKMTVTSNQSKAQEASFVERNGNQYTKRTLVSSSPQRHPLTPKPEAIQTPTRSLSIPLITRNLNEECDRDRELYKDDGGLDYDDDNEDDIPANSSPIWIRRRPSQPASAKEIKC